MGICRSLYKIDIGESYELGKVFWQIFYREPFILPQLYKVPTDLAFKIAQNINEGYWEEDCKKNSFLYSNRWANRIWEWCKWDRIMMIDEEEVNPYGSLKFYQNKYDFLYKEKEFKETGSLYFPKVSE